MSGFRDGGIVRRTRELTGAIRTMTITKMDGTTTRVIGITKIMGITMTTMIVTNLQI